MDSESLAHAVPEVNRALLRTGLEVICVTSWQSSGFGLPVLRKLYQKHKQTYLCLSTTQFIE